MLPNWITENLPEAETPAVISFDGEHYVRTEPDGEQNKFPTLEEAYDHASTRNLSFDESVKENMDGFAYVPTEDKRYSRLLLAISTAERLEMLVHQFQDFLTVAQDYYASPESFRRAYHYVTMHPAFWTRHEAEPTYEWDNDYADKVWMRPYFKDGKTTWMLEAGGHIAPDYTSHYHDLRLDVYAASVEEGYIKLAAKVAQFFNDDGTEKENVEYEKSELELLLEERMSGLEDGENAEEG